MGVFEELRERGIIAQTTNEEGIKKLLENGQVTFYIGFDPTADSLHVGHYLQLMVMAHMQRAGHRPIAVIGGGTTMLGDPSGRTDMRMMMTKADIDRNGECFKKQMRRLVDFEDGRALMVDNGGWLLGLNYVEFLRDIGVCFSINRMLTQENIKNRLEKGLTFMEFNYTLMQSYDFLVLFQQYGCTMQFGGDDQWSNILGGVDLVRRKEGKEVYGMTFQLLTTSAGVKMGKTQKGAVWLDPEKTTPFEFYQYWRNIDDADVLRCMKMLTFIPVREIDERFGSLEGSGLNAAKELLAYELTRGVHGENEADKCREAAQALFSASALSDNMPTVAVMVNDFTNGSITVVELMAKCGLAPSKGEARRLIQQGGVAVDDEKVADIDRELTADDFGKGYVVLRKGKKVFLKVELK